MNDVLFLARTRSRRNALQLESQGIAAMTPSAHNLGDGPVPATPPRAAFTPGPWTAEFTDTPYEEIGEGWVVDGPNGSICTLDCPLDEREAAARLIAAAPELYATLEYVREMLVAYGPRYIEKPVALADAALAKARGEAA